MSSFMVNANVMAKVVTAILQNTDRFAAIDTFRGYLIDDPPTDPQKQAGTKIGRTLFLMNRRALRERYGQGDHLRQPPAVPNPCQIQRRPTEYSGESRGHSPWLPDQDPDSSSLVELRFYWVAGQGFEPWKASADGFLQIVSTHAFGPETR